MPCTVDPPSENQDELRRVNKFIVYTVVSLPRVRLDIRAHLARAEEHYGDTTTLNEDTEKLCGLVDEMTDEEKERVIYNAHNPTARDMAAWYERHQKWDREVKVEEARRKEQATVLLNIKSKITPKEWEVLKGVLAR